MMTKCLFVLFASLMVAVSNCSAGLVPAAVPAALTVGTYATSYNAHAVNHAIAAPYVSAAYAAAPAVAAPVAAPFAASPFAYSAYSAYPYAPAPYFAFRR